MTKYDLQRFSYGLVTEESATNFDIGSGRFSFQNHDSKLNPNNVFIPLGNCSAASASWDTNVLKKYWDTRGTRMLAASAETQRGMTLSITMDESDPVKYALACYGQTAIKKIPATTLKKVPFKISPGDEIFIEQTIAGENIIAYNYENLKIERAVNTAAKINPPVLDTQGSVNAPTGSINASGTYTGTDSADYYIKITAANSAQGTITDAEFAWKKGISGTYSSPIAATGTTQIIDEGIEITFAAGTSGQDFNTNDEWKIEVFAAQAALVAGEDYTADDVDVKDGKVTFPVSSNIDFNTEVHVSCDVPEQNIPRVYAGIQKEIIGTLRFEYDPTHGRNKSYKFYKVKITPNGDDSSLISTDWGNRQIQAEVMADPKHADPDNANSMFYRVDYPGDSSGMIEQR